MNPRRQKIFLIPSKIAIIAIMLTLAACADENNNIPTNPSSFLTTVPMPSSANQPQPRAEATATATATTTAIPLTSLDKAQFISIIRDLENKNLAIMAVAQQKALNQEAPDFQVLKSKLLLYNSEKATKHWEVMYDKEPGWILEPKGLVFAGKHSMLESSFKVEQVVDGKVNLTFKTYGDSQYSRSHHIAYTLIGKNGTDWIIDSIQATTLVNAFNQDEATEAMTSEFGEVKFVKEDDTYYLKLRSLKWASKP
ncbi:hypothetical protein GCM10008018_72950 [Paenibacillus marchantiophytorum]|uniref:DUF3993 domain-containing protein n=1 Tax=Paenibacillus marchantiophytorum TaxID=1619310 RepID=A0ABQ1FLN2_9BACL|nr:hypothetical protein [Paenibacillus marchantiophytorum]GGA18551.1 hypothetical protein GCM10008018_72950 [Paenibacillus marchantiophytorum]